MTKLDHLTIGDVHIGYTVLPDGAADVRLIEYCGIYVSDYDVNRAYLHTALYELAEAAADAFLADKRRNELRNAFEEDDTLEAR